MSNGENATRALALSQPHPDLPSEVEWNIIQRMSKMFAESGLYPQIKNVAHAIAIVQTGRELGIPPSVALREFSIIGGKPTASAGILAGLCQRDHGDLALRVTEYEDDHCTVQFRRRGWPAASSVTFTMDDAKRAGLLDPQQTRNGVREPNANWFKFPRSMLRSRAISEAARTAFQDSTLGMYTPEELAPELVTVTEDGEVVLDAAVIDVTPEPATPQPENATPPAANTPAGDEATTKKHLAIQVKDLCARHGLEVPASGKDWSGLAESLGMPALTSPQEMTVEWLEQVKTRLERQAGDDGPIGYSSEFVRVRDAIAAATTGDELVRLLDDDLDLSKLAEGEYDDLNARAERRHAALPQPAGVTV